jgi:RNA-binding protein 23/39
MGGRGAHAGGTANFDRASGKEAEKTGGASALDDTDVSGVNFSNYSRDALMRKLARTDEPEQKVAPKAQAKKPQIEEAPPSRCVLIKHMFDQERYVFAAFDRSAACLHHNSYREAAANPTGWQKELEDDVREECNEQYGIVVHLAIALDSDEGEVYVKFDRVDGGKNAVRGLNGRFFGGQRLTAQYVVDHVYNMMYPAAANK